VLLEIFMPEVVRHYLLHDLVLLRVNDFYSLLVIFTVTHHYLQ